MTTCSLPRARFAACSPTPARAMRTPVEPPPAGGGLICPDADLDFHPDELGLFDAFDVIDEMRDDLPNLKHVWRDDDGTRVTLVAETGEMLVASYAVIERGIAPAGLGTGSASR